MTSRIPVMAAMTLLCASAPAVNAEVTHNLGLSGGFPQMIAITYQAELTDYFALESYVGSLAFLNTTAGIRGILGSTGSGIKPRCFAGMCLVDQYYGDNSDDPHGTETYPWIGAGLALEFDSGFGLFGDLVYIGDGDLDRGLGSSTGLTFSGGILFRL